MKLKNDKKIIQAQLRTGQRGIVIGTYNGIVGLLLGDGSYIDVPEKQILLKKDLIKKESLAADWDRERLKILNSKRYNPGLRSRK